MKASRVINGARILLKDPDGVRWDDSTLLRWLNGAQLAIVGVRPDAKATKVDLDLVPGVEQSIPAGGTRLLDVPRNVAGRAITLISRDDLNAYDPDWYSGSPAAIIKHYTFDESDPKSFEVYPPAAAGAKARVLFAAIPTDCATLDADVDLDDIFEGPLIDGICYRAWSEDGDSAPDAGRAANALATFMQALTGKSAADQASRPARK